MMLGPLILNLLAVARWVNVVNGSPQYYNRDRPSYRNDDISRKGSYRITGYLPLYGDDIYSGVIDSRSRYDSGSRYNSFRRSYSGEERCPYDNEKLLRKKRSINDTEAGLMDRLKRQASGLEYSRYKSRSRGRYDDRYYNYDNNNRYYDRVDDRYRYNDDRRYRQYDDRYRTDRYDDYRYRNGDSRVRTYPCGKEICTWEARLECNLSGYSGGGYDRIEWIREHDAYYPKDQFRDLMEYCGTRCSVDRDGTLVINNVKSEDKGVYRCYVAGGDKRDFMEVTFYPKYPLSSNDDC